jgi:hypothetical protein
VANSIGVGGFRKVCHAFDPTRDESDAHDGDLSCQHYTTFSSALAPSGITTIARSNPS